jgi:hypothetical protein
MYAERFTNGPYTIQNDGDQIKITLNVALDWYFFIYITELKYFEFCGGCFMIAIPILIGNLCKINRVVKWVM